VTGTPCLTNCFSILSVDQCNESDSLDENISGSTPSASSKEAEVPNNPSLNPPPVILIRSGRALSTELNLHLETVDNHNPFQVQALLDSGATDLFVDEEFVKAKNLTRTKLPRSIPVYNIDGSLNEHGSVKETVDLVVRYQDHTLLT
jgi:hypothetical protein